MSSARTKPFQARLAVAAFFIGLTSLAGPTQSQAADYQNVAYGRVAGQSLLLDVYGADRRASKPAVVLIHGGSWTGGNKADMATIGQFLAQQGYVAFSVGYRLAHGNNKFPAQLDDVQRSVRWIRKNARSYGVNPNRMGALGLSAGGHLAAFLGTRDTRDNSDKSLAKYSSRVQCVVDIFGPMDLTLAARDYSGGAAQTVMNLVGGDPRRAPARYRDASPITFVNKKTAPFLLLHGVKDVLVPVDQSRRMYTKLRQNRVPAQLVLLPNSGHGLEGSDFNTTVYAALGFLGKYLRPTGGGRAINY